MRLFVGNLPFSASSSDVREYFHGATGFMPVEVVIPSDAENNARGFAFVKFAAGVNLPEICNRLASVAELGGRKLRLSIATPPWVAMRERGMQG